MRTIRVEERESGHTWVWLAAAAVVGLGVGVYVARRTNGRRVSLRALVARGRGMASTLADNIGPLMETAREIKDAWDGDADEELDDDELDDDLDEDLDDEDDAADDDDADDDDDEDDDDDDDDDADEDDEDDEEEAQAHEALDARVLEAFSHDPILSERAVEIEDIGEGVILLHGRVRDQRELKHAVTMARGVPGVTRVREKLAVVRTR